MATTHNLPHPFTPFIGRDSDIADIARRLSDPHCRLLTLVGPGGIGKSRLAIEAARQLAEIPAPPERAVPSFAHGVHFVDLQPVNASEVLVTAIANSVGLLLSGPEDPREQLLDDLSAHEILLLLDNFEQLLDSADLLGDILQIAPGVKLLVTSREALNMQEEWLWQVGGLQVPDHPSGTNFESCSAVQLFAERARRTRQDFTLTGQETPVTRICQLVDGLPLALELAAGWTKALSCAEIAQEIQRGLDVLMTNIRNVPERHRSMQAVFDQSWRLLTDAERQVFPLLSVFRGGFRREAAEQVAGASLSVLAGLVDKSFLRLSAAGRYEIHELMRQYGEEKLAAKGEEYDDILDRHCGYYAEFLRQKELAIWAGGEKEQEALREFENIRVAWHRAVIRAKHSLIQRFVIGLQTIYETRGWWLEAATSYAWAADQLRSETPTGEQGISFGLTLTFQGFIYRRVGRVEEGKQLSLKGLSILRALAAREALAWNYIFLHSHGSDYSPEIVEDYAEMSGLLHEGLTTFETIDEKLGKGYTLLTLGNVARDGGDYESSRQYYQQGLMIEKQRGALRGMAWAVWGLADVAKRSGKFSEAREHMVEFLRLLRAANESGLRLPVYMVTLGEIEYGLGNYHSASQRFCEALAVTMDKTYMASKSLEILVWLSRLLVEDALRERAVEVLSLVRHHPASQRHVQDEATRLLNELEMDVPLKAFARAVERGRVSHLENVARALLEQFRFADDEPRLATAQTPNPSLIEPLSERELEVLQLIASGFSNTEIADRLVVGLSTIKKHVNHIYSKLGVQTRTQALVRAQELHLL